MREKLLLGLNSLRFRLIVTYMLVIIVSFILLLGMVMSQIKQAILQREEDKLVSVAITLGSTINTPWADDEAYDRDLYWTQRRCSLYLQQSLPETNFRVLDAMGNLLVDSRFKINTSQEWQVWKAQRGEQSLPVAQQLEISKATVGKSISFVRFAQRTTADTVEDRLFVAVPILRQQGRVAFIILLDRSLSSVAVDVAQVRKRIIRDGMLVCLLITIVVSLFFANYLSRGLSAAMQVAHAFADGQMEIRMRSHGYDEVARLGLSFNLMADSLQRQEKMRRDLLADVSHELRTPLTAISACADTLAYGDSQIEPEAISKFLRIIQRESLRMQRLVADILELSKLQAKVTAIPLSPVLICPIIDDVVAVVRLQAEKDGISVNWRPTDCPDNLLVLANTDRLAQAVQNLLDNARHHTPAGKAISVTILLSAEKVTLDVCDEGEGISAAELPAVFDRFYRSGKGDKAEGGNGLGLAIVREIVIAHQGEITVSSELGVGTCFSLQLKSVQAEKMANIATN